MSEHSELPPTWDYDGLDPIRVQVHFTAHTPESLRKVLDEQTEMFRAIEAKPKSYFIVIDARSMERAGPETRKMQAEWMEQHHDYFARTCVGMAFVMRSRIVRGALTAIFWVARKPVPYTVHPDLQAALDHAELECELQGLTTPSVVGAAERIEQAIQAEFGPLAAC